MRQKRNRIGTRADGLQRSILILQLLATAVVLAWVPGNVAKLAMMVLVWALGFGRVTRGELLLTACVDALFVLMDIATLKQGAFRFAAPDLLGLPVYEFLMWGFYILNAMRFVGGNPPEGSLAKAVALAVVFALPFTTIQDYGLLFLTSALVLALAIGFFHQSYDLAFVAYMVLMGAIIEYTGVKSGQWAYDGVTLWGVPLWFATMWGGIGLFGRRLALPLMLRFERA